MSFAIRDGVLAAESVPLPRIAGEVGTPVYVYSQAALLGGYARLNDALTEVGLDPLICYAIKANGNLAVVRALARAGAGADVVSQGEMRRALIAGIPGERIVFSGVGKTAAEMAAGLKSGIGQFNVESEPELEALAAVARAGGGTARIAIRVNPNVDALTHAKISTGRKGDKFGIEMARVPEVFARAAALEGVEPVGLAVHIGSQITALEPFRRAYAALADLAKRLRDAGHAIQRLDLGGGLGIVYHDEAPPSPADYARMVRATVADLGCRLIFEPGRAIAGPAGVLLTKVLYVKHAMGRRYVIVDAGMNDLARAAVYDAWHAIRPVREGGEQDAGEGATLSPADVVGPVCETADTFARDRALPKLEAGALLAIENAGAYGSVMASTYNSRLLIPEVLVNDSRYAVVRARQSYDEMLAAERIADWQTP